MIVLLSSIIGFLSSSLPSLLNYFQDKTDKAHELEILKLQIQAQQVSANNQLEAIKALSEANEMIALHNSEKPTGTWVDILNASVRPIIAYLFFLSYVVTRIFLYFHLEASGASFDLMVQTLWDDQDMSILAGILSFYYGSRVFEKK